MTEKRFEWCCDGIDMWDNQKEERIDSIDFEEAFNELAKENEQLKSENQQIRDTINEMHNNERTYIGKSILKQVIEAIQ